MEKRVPQRRCCGCMEMKPKSQLIRVVKSNDGKVTLDLTGKMNGRGAYICNDTECFAKARKAKRIQRALSCEISEDVFDSMEALISKNE